MILINKENICIQYTFVTTQGAEHIVYLPTVT